MKNHRLKRTLAVGVAVCLLFTGITMLAIGSARDLRDTASEG